MTVLKKSGCVEDFVPLKILGMSCFDSSITSIVAWEKDEYYKTYMFSWQFRFCNEEQIESISYRKKVEALYGISVEQMCDDEPETAIEFIRNELKQNKPIMVCGDEFFCPWMFNYKLNHNHDHIYIIVGECDNGFKCVDAYPYAVDEVITYDDFRNGYRYLIVYQNEIVDKFERSLYGGIDYLKKCVFEQGILNQISTTEMDTFVQHIADRSMNELLGKEENVWDTTLYTFIDRLYGGRVQFLEFLNEISRNEASICAYISQMAKIVEKWGIVISLVTKAFILKKDGEKIKNKILIHIIEIVTMEKHLKNCMLDVGNYSVNQEMPDQKKDKIVFVNLRDYKKSTELYFDREHILMYDEVPRNRIWNVSDMVFDFQIYGEFDCICCNEENIAIDHAEYQYVMFLGYATYENQIEELTIVYSDQSEDKMEIEFADWCVEARYGFEKAWEGKCKSLDDGKIYMGKIYARKYKLPNAHKKIERIVLPKNQKIHIYAISFA